MRFKNSCSTFNLLRFTRPQNDPSTYEHNRRQFANSQSEKLNWGRGRKSVITLVSILLGDNNSKLWDPFCKKQTFLQLCKLIDGLVRRIPQVFYCLFQQKEKVGKHNGQSTPDLDWVKKLTDLLIWSYSTLGWSLKVKSWESLKQESSQSGRHFYITTNHEITTVRLYCPQKRPIQGQLQHLCHICISSIIDPMTLNRNTVRDFG